jgi:hypothetical protein
MRHLHDPNTTRTAASRAWVRRLLIPGALVAAGLAATGCGGAGAPTILNTEKVERAIEQSSLAQRGEHARVSCPSGVHQKKGLTFACTAVVGSATTQFAVTQQDGSGRVHYEAR